MWQVVYYKTAEDEVPAKWSFGVVVRYKKVTIEDENIEWGFKKKEDAERRAREIESIEVWGSHEKKYHNVSVREYDKKDEPKPIKL